MKILKKVLIAVLIIIALPFVLALFVKNEYRVEREIVIQKPQAEVFSFLKILKNQEQYNKWVMMDPEMKKNYQGIDGTEGFVYSWDGEKAGKGEQEITSIVEGKSLQTELRFIKPFESKAVADLQTEDVSANETKVRWGMAGRSPYPMNIMNLFIDNLLGADLQSSLTALKNSLEKQ